MTTERSTKAITIPLLPEKLITLRKIQKTPSLGILTADGHPLFRGNHRNFMDIAHTGAKMGISVVIITPDNFLKCTQNGWIKCFRLQSNMHNWVPAILPLPRVIYNRLPNRKIEQHPRTQLVLKKISTLPQTQLFNHGFFDKWSIYKHLSKSEILNQFVPETTLLSLPNLQKLFQKFPTLYIKPINGKAGINIMRLTKNDYEYELIHQLQKSCLKYKLNSLSKLWKNIITKLAKEKYILQQGIDLMHYKNRPFDIRTLVQKNGHGYFSVTGSGIRVAGDNAISTHIPRGGSIADLSKVFRHVFHDQATYLEKRICDASILVAKYIEKKQKTTLGELSIDWGMNKNGQLWFFETNAKPMKFDEQNIRTRSLHNLVAYSIYLTNNILKIPLSGEEEPCG